MSVLIALISPLALAADPPPDDRLYHEGSFAFRVNPLGLQGKYALGWRHRLIDAPADSTLFGDTWTWIAPVATITPAFGKGGLMLQTSPIALLRLSATWEGIGYFGTFDQVQSFPSADADYSDNDLDGGSDDGRATATAGMVTTLEGRLQARVGPIAARHTATLTSMKIKLPAGDTSFYDPTYDLLVPNGRWMLQDDTDLLLAPEDVGWVIGARWTQARAFHGEPGAQGQRPIDRVGPLFSYRFYKKPGAAFDTPMLLVLSQFHVRHPYRSGQESSILLPYLVVAFAFTGDLIP